MKVIDVGEAKSHLEDYARECHSSPVVVTVGGKPSFEMLPIRSDDPDFTDRLLATNAEFGRLMEERRKEADERKVSSLESVREQLAHCRHRHQSKLHLQMKRLSDPLEPGERFAFVIGTLKSRNNRLLGADQIGSRAPFGDSTTRR